MAIPKKLVINMIALYGVLLFVLSVVSVAVGFIILEDPQEFRRSPEMAMIFTIGLLVLIVIFVSSVMLIRHHPNSIRLFTWSGVFGLFLTWLVSIVIAVVYENGEGPGLFFFLALLFSPLYIQIYLINFQDDVRQWIEPNPI